MSNLSVLDKNELTEQTPEIQTQSSISFFSVFTENNEKLEESKNINQIFWDDWNLEQIFWYNHSFEIENNKLKISWLEDINFEFSLTSLTKKSGISLITFEVKNLANNLTRRQRHYLQSVFYNLKESWFNIKYIDDNFSDLTQKDYVIWHRCNAWDVCDLVSSFKDSFKQDDEKIKQNLELLKNWEWDFEEFKKEIISKEISNILNFRLALEHLIFTRNEILKKDNKNIDYLVLKNWLQNSVLAWNHFDEDKIFEIEKDLTDGVLIWSFSILKILEWKLVELLEFFEEIDKIEDNKKKVELIGKVVKTSNDIFLQAEKTARKNWILSILNPRNWFWKKKEEIENKKLTKQQEIDEAMDVMVELLNYKQILYSYYLNNVLADKYFGKKYLSDKFFRKEYLKLEELQEKYSDNSILNTLKIVLWKYKWALWLWKEKIDLLEEKYREGFKKQFNNNFYIWADFPFKWISFEFSNYSDLEKIFEKYEEFLKILYFQDYAFKKSKYTNDYQKVLYKKWEFYLDENAEFEDYSRKFFKEVGEVFREKQSEKTKVWERLDFEIIEKADKKIEDLSKINNIFDIKIWENIFPIYVVNPIKKDNLAESEKDYSKDKVVTIWTSLQNNLDVLDELLKTSNEVNRQKLQSAIKQEAKDILVMNFDLKDRNYEKDRIDF